MKRQNLYPNQLFGASTLDSFGMLMRERTYSSANYRFGFNGKEKTDELNGDGIEMDFGDRVLDTRLGQWLSMDPEFESYSGQSPYISSGDNPILFYDPTGSKIFIYYQVEETDQESGKKKTVGKYYEVGSKEKIPNSRYVRKTLRTLNRIERRGKDQIGIISDLENSTTANVQIFNSAWNDAGVNIGISQAIGTYPDGDTWPIEAGTPDQIIWATNGGIISPDGKLRLSPAAVLLHELAHTYYVKHDPGGHIAAFNKIAQIADPEKRQKAYELYAAKEQLETGEYGSYEEEWVIKNAEANFSTDHRKTHGGYLLKTIGGTTSKKGFKVANKMGQKGSIRDLKKGKKLK